MGDDRTALKMPAEPGVKTLVRDDSAKGLPTDLDREKQVNLPPGSATPMSPSDGSGGGGGGRVVPKYEENTPDNDIPERMRTLPTPGEDYGHPTKYDYGYVTRRHDVAASDEDSEVEDGLGDEVEGEPMGREAYKSRWRPGKRQRKQRGRKRTKRKQRYRRNRQKEKNRAKRYYRRNKNKAGFKKVRRHRRKHPGQHKRRNAAHDWNAPERVPPAKKQRKQRGRPRQESRREYRENRTRKKLEMSRRHDRLMNRKRYRDYKKWYNKEYRERGEKPFRRRASVLTTPQIAFGIGPDLLPGYVHSVSPMTGMVTFVVEAKDQEPLRSMPVMPFLRSVVFLSEDDIDAMFDLIDVEIGEEAYEDMDESVLRECADQFDVDVDSKEFADRCMDLVGEDDLSSMTTDEIDQVTDKLVLSVLEGGGRERDDEDDEDDEGPDDEYDWHLYYGEVPDPDRGWTDEELKAAADTFVYDQEAPEMEIEYPAKGVDYRPTSPEHYEYSPEEQHGSGRVPQRDWTADPPSSRVVPPGDGKFYEVDLSYLHTAARMPMKGQKPGLNFYGWDSGQWMETPEFLMGADSREMDWEMLGRMSRQNEWRNYMVEGATAHHPGFLKALREMVRKYPELEGYWLKFDGPWTTVAEVLGSGDASDDFDWGRVTLYHGTSMEAWGSIQRQGLRPRRETGAGPAYGAGVGAAPGKDEAVYLTAETGMAHWAALDAAKGGGTPVVIEVSAKGLDPARFAPDEDSRETTAEGSLARMGSVAYMGRIPPANLELVEVRENRRWRKVATRRRAFPADRILEYAIKRVMDIIEPQVRRIGHLIDVRRDDARVSATTPEDYLYSQAWAEGTFKDRHAGVDFRVVGANRLTHRFDGGVVISVPIEKLIDFPGKPFDAKRAAEAVMFSLLGKLERPMPRGRTATTISEIMGNTAGRVHERSGGFKPRLKRADPKRGIWTFQVTGSSGDVYTLRVKGIRKPHNIKAMNKAQVKVSCSCPFFRWQGPEHWAKTNRYLYGRPRGTATKPVVKDPDGQHWACKHVLAVLRMAQNYRMAGDGAWWPRDADVVPDYSMAQVVAARYLGRFARTSPSSLIADLHRVIGWVDGRWAVESGHYEGKPWFDAAVLERAMPVRLELRRGWGNVLRELVQMRWLEFVKYSWEEDGVVHQGTAVRPTKAGREADRKTQAALAEPDVNPFGLTEKEYVKRRTRQLVKRQSYLESSHRRYRDQAAHEYAAWEQRAKRSPAVWERHERALGR